MANKNFEVKHGLSVGGTERITSAGAGTLTDLTLSGNLTVGGSSTTLNVATLDVEDKNITLNKGSGDTSSSANGAGITIQDAVDASTDATLLWNNSTDNFELSHGLHMDNASHILIERGGEFRSLDTGSNTKTIARVNSSNELEYGWSGSGPVKFMGGGSYTERLRIHTDGNIGINDTDPEGTLTVTGPRILVQRTNDDSSITFANNSTGSVSGPTWAIGRNYSNSEAFTFAYHASSIPSLESSVAVIKTNGFLGLGTTNPLDLIHIKSSTTDARQVIDGHTGYDAELKYAVNGTVKYTTGYDSATDKFVIGTANVDSSPRMTIDSSGFVNFPGTASVTGKFAVLNASVHASYDFYNNGTTYLNGAAIIDNSLHISGSGASLRVDGKAGILNSSPNGTLHIGDGTNSNVTVGSQSTPALQIGGTNNYRLGMYTDSEAGYIENKNGDNGLRFNVKTLGEVLRLTTDSRIITGDISVYINEYSRNISINNVTDSSNNGFSEYVAWVGTNVRWDDSANTWKRATEDSNQNWGGISGIVYGSDSLKFVTAPYNNATGSGGESSIGSLPALVSMTLNSAGNLYLTGGNDRRIKLSDSGIAGVSDSNNTVHIRGDNDFMKLNAAGNGGFIFEENGAERLRIKPGGNVGIGSNNPAALLEIAGSGDAIRVESTNSGAGGAQIDLLHFSASPADGDTHAYINMGGYYSGTTSSYASSIRSKWKDVAARETELDFYMRTNKPSGFYRKVTMHSDSGVEIQPPNTSNAEGQSNTVIGFYHYYKTSPGASYAHMKTNMPTGGNGGTFGMIAIEATGYKYNTGDCVKGMWGFHNWNNGTYSQVAANLISSSSNGYNFCSGTYVSSDGYIVLVANSGGTTSVYLGARLDFIDIQADYQKHGTAYWPPKVTAISWSNNSTGVY